MPPRKTKTQRKKHSLHLTHIPLPSWIAFWLAIAATFVLVFVTFGAAFSSFFGPESDTAIQALQQINQNLAQQVSELRAQATNPESTENCLVENPGPADSHILYVDPKTHVSMSLPYSTKWGNGCAPLLATDTGIQFGPIMNKNFDSEISILASDAKVPTSSNRTTVSGVTVYTIPAGPQNKATWVAVGRTHTYMITSDGWLSKAEINRLIQSLRVVK